MITSHPAYASPESVHEPGIQTRSGRALGSASPATESDSRLSRSPRVRGKRHQKKTGRKGGPIIDQPLSVLTRDYKTPLKDMGAHVHRSVERRRAEVEGNKGHVPRPMNSFMLYRSAYAERAKQFCKENNHQVVSQVTGASWPLEPKEVRGLYENYALLERDNHAAAHPEYKFAPNKSKRVRQDEDPSDSDPDWEGSPAVGKRNRNLRYVENRSATSSPFDPHQVQYQQAMPSLQLSGYEIPNPYGITPVMVRNEAIAGQYYQTAPSVGYYTEPIPNVRYGSVEDPYAAYQNGLGLVGMPHTTHHELLTSDPSPQHQSHMHIPGDMIDPRLDQAGSGYEAVFYGENDQVEEQSRAAVYEPINDMEMGYDPEAIHPGLATLTNEHDVWGDAANVGMDFESEFQKLS